MAQYEGTKVNIVSLGAGYDTTYFWLKKNQPDIDDKINYIEIDFTQVVKRKSTIIKDKPQFHDIIIPGNSGNETLGPHDLDTPGYKLLESDVRDGTIILNKLRALDVNPDLPTLILTECLLIYMRSDDTQSVLNWTMDYFGAQGDITYVNYEMINPDD